MVLQDVFLFNGTVAENIAYGSPSATLEEIIEAATAAGADEFIRDMPNGYDTHIGERGVRLSGGQKQRLALARALSMKPSVLILDDTTSAVDMETEKFIQQQLRTLDFPCTKMIVAQRISSLKNADQIIVLDHGRIIEWGTHAQLLRKHGYYYRIWALQNSVEEEEVHLGA